MLKDIRNRNATSEQSQRTLMQSSMAQNETLLPLCISSLAFECFIGYESKHMKLKRFFFELILQGQKL